MPLILYTKTWSLCFPGEGAPQIAKLPANLKGSEPSVSLLSPLEPEFILTGSLARALPKRVLESTGGCHGTATSDTVRAASRPSCSQGHVQSAPQP